MPRKLGVLERVFGRQLSKQGIGWVNCWNGVSWILDLSDPTQRWIVFGKYEGGLGIDFASSVLISGGVYIDSGANIGQWALYLAGMKGVRTLAFEPVDSQRARLEKSVLGQQDWNVQIFPFGLGAEHSHADIQIDGPRSTLRSDWYQAKGLDTQRIEIVSLAKVLADNNVETVKFWKLDVEGAELSAMVGANEYLADQQIENIFFECHPSNYGAICELLQHNRYEIYDLGKHGLTLKRDKLIDETENLVARPRR